MEIKRRRKRMSKDFNNKVNPPKKIRRKMKLTKETATVSKKTAKEKQKPLRRANSASTQLGLTVLLYPDVKQYKLSVNSFEGFKVSSIIAFVT